MSSFEVTVLICRGSPPTNCPERARETSAACCGTRELGLCGRKLGLCSRCIRARTQLSIDLRPNDASQDLRTIHSGLCRLNGFLGGDESQVSVGRCDGDFKLRAL